MGVHAVCRVAWSRKCNSILIRPSSLPNSVLSRIPLVRFHSLRPVDCSPFEKRQRNAKSRVLISGHRLRISASAPCRRSEPLVYPTEGYTLLPADKLLEEELVKQPKLDSYYPVRLGEVFNDRYQILAKLGYGVSSTTWLARDLEEPRYVALKIGVNSDTRRRDIEFYDRLKKSLPTGHPGAEGIRRSFGSFELKGQHRIHKVLVQEAGQINLNYLYCLFMKDQIDGFNIREEAAKMAIRQMCLVLDFLHTEMEVVHCNVENRNMLLGLEEKDGMVWKAMESEILSEPLQRKILPDREIYTSQAVSPRPGPFWLCGFGETRFGLGPHVDDPMTALILRPPELLLGIPWSTPVDVWCLGLTAWHLMESDLLFTSGEEEEYSAAAQLAEMIAVMGPPPVHVLAQNPMVALQFWDGNG
ncbi:hypothetical protein ABW19_dt0205640 [Dactylella cylindrospora]|nr:hypothetical protein ABW19_dt0205640 [Dactylella cylindrospora]